MKTLEFAELQVEFVALCEMILMDDGSWSSRKQKTKEALHIWNQIICHELTETSQEFLTWVKRHLYTDKVINRCAITLPDDLKEPLSLWMHIQEYNTSSLTFTPLERQLVGGVILRKIPKAVGQECIKHYEKLILNPLNIQISSNKNDLEKLKEDVFKQEFSKISPDFFQWLDINSKYFNISSDVEDLWKNIYQYLHSENIETKKFYYLEIKKEITNIMNENDWFPSSLTYALLLPDIIANGKIVRNVYLSEDKELIELFEKYVPKPPLSLFAKDRVPECIKEHAIKGAETVQNVIKCNDGNIQKVEDAAIKIQRYFRKSKRRGEDRNRIRYKLHGTSYQSREEELYQYLIDNKTNTSLLKGFNDILNKELLLKNKYLVSKILTSENVKTYYFKEIFLSIIKEKYKKAEDPIVALLSDVKIKLGDDFPAPLAEILNFVKKEKIDNIINDINKPYKPKCDSQLANRLLKAAKKIKPFTTIRHLAATNAIASILDDGFLGRNSLLHRYKSFREAALHIADMLNGDGDVICFGAFNIDSKCMQPNTVEFVLNLDKLRSLSSEKNNPCIFFKQMDLGLKFKKMREVTIGETPIIFSHTEKLQHWKNRVGTKNIQFLDEKGRSNVSAILPDVEMLSSNFTDMYSILAMNFFRFLDQARDDQNGKHAETFIKRIYKKFSELNDENLEDVLLQLTRNMSDTMEFNFYGSFLMKPELIEEINIFNNPDEKTYTLKMVDFLDALQKGDSDKLLEVKQNIPQLFQSYRFIDYLLNFTENDLIKNKLLEYKKDITLPLWRQYVEESKHKGENQGIGF